MSTNDTRLKIIEAAMTEFSMKVYETASLNEILMKANVSKSSFYYFFKNKKDLYSHLLVESLNTKNKYIAQRVVLSDCTNLSDYIYEHLNAGLEFADNHPNYQKLALVYSTDTTSPISREWLYAHGDFHSVNNNLADVIARARSAGEINAVFSDEFVIGAVAVVFGQFNQLFPGLDPGDRSAVKEAVMKCSVFVVNGLKKGLS